MRTYSEEEKLGFRKKFEGLYQELLEIDNMVYEAILEKLYTMYIEKGEFAIDIGAHLGRHTFPMAKAVGSEGEIYAFEPLKRLYQKIKERIEDGNLQNVIKLYSYALSRAPGEGIFLFVEDAPGLSGLKERTSHGGHNISRISVQVEKLDNIVPLGKKVSFIKIDAEGADFDILRGAERILENDRPLIVFESGRINAFPAKSYNYTEEEFNGFFKDRRYILYDIAGFKYDQYFWSYPTLNDFVAIPKECEYQCRELLQAAVVSVLGKYVLNAN